MDVFLSLHGALARSLILYLAVVGIWGLANGVRGKRPSGSFVGALVVGVVATVVQGAFGVLTYFRAGPREPLHVLYGFALVLALPMAWTYARSHDDPRASLFLGLATLFASGLAIRGLTTS